MSFAFRRPKNWFKHGRRAPITGPIPLETRKQVRSAAMGLVDGLGKLIWTIAIGGCDDARRRDWLERLVAAGVTHIDISRASTYPRYHEHAGIAPFWLDDAAWIALIELCLSYGLIPMIMMPFDEGPSIELGVSSGALAKEARIVKRYASMAVFCPGWEIAGHTRAITCIRAQQILRRELGEDACLAQHAQPGRMTVASYWGEGQEGDTPAAGLFLKLYDDGRRDPKTGRRLGCWTEVDDPSLGDEAGAWDHDVEPDVFLYQDYHGDGCVNGRNEIDDTGAGESWLKRLLEGIDRFSPPGVLIRLFGRVVRGQNAKGYRAPDWFGGTRRKRGRPTFIAWEMGWADLCAHPELLARLPEALKLMADIGVQYYGCGVADEFKFKEAA